MSARVLVVDDILPNVKLLEAKLKSEYYDVLTAMNGPEALEKVQNESPDIVLLDVMMPGMDGFEVCRRIKENPAVAHIPVVMVTALTDTEDKVRGLESGADDFLSKPINDTALMARVRSLIRLKMALDEWRVRENAATQLGVASDADAVHISDENAQILVIEDQDFERDKIMQTLQEKGHKIVCVSNGPDSIEIAVAPDAAFDLICISLNLASEDGLRLCSHFRSNEKTRSIPILMMGQNEDLDKIAHGLEIGAHDYIIRPIERNELTARVRTQIRRKRFQEKLRASYEMSLSLALTDSLTGLYNRRYLEVHLEKLLEKNKESRKSLCVLMMDIDHFKAVNDTHGHGVGDEVLKIFSDRMKENLRSFDLVARYGGEEFVAILPDVSHEMAYIVAERLRRAICEDPIPCAVEGGTLNISTSIGGAIIDHEHHTMAEVLERADKCLYAAKEAGRNCSYFENVGKLDPEDHKGSLRALNE